MTDLRPLHLLVSIRFQILFHRPPGLLFNVPSLYWFTIGQEEYLVLAHRRACFRLGFSGLVVLWIWTGCADEFHLPDYHRLWFHFPVDSIIHQYYPCISWENTCPSRNPLISMTHVRHPARGTTCVILGAKFEYESLDCSHFARHYLGNPLFSFFSSGY